MPRKFDLKEDLIYVECGDKLNYAACWLPEQDGDLEFLGWIRKFCYKYGRKMKVSADDLGITYKGFKAKMARKMAEQEPEPVPVPVPEEPDPEPEITTYDSCEYAAVI